MEVEDTEAVVAEAGSAEAECVRARSLVELEDDNNLDLKRESNELHDAFRQGPSASTLQLQLIREQPLLLSQQDDTWEGWLPLHHAARWGTLRSVAEAAIAAFAGAAKTVAAGIEAVVDKFVMGHLVLANTDAVSGTSCGET